METRTLELFECYSSSKGGESEKMKRRLSELTLGNKKHKSCEIKEEI